MAGIIHKGSDTHKLHLKLLAAEKSAAEAEKKLAAEKSAGDEKPKVPERKTENK